MAQHVSVGHVEGHQRFEHNTVGNLCPKCAYSQTTEEILVVSVRS